MYSINWLYEIYGKIVTPCFNSWAVETCKACKLNENWVDLGTTKRHWKQNPAPARKVKLKSYPTPDFLLFKQYSGDPNTVYANTRHFWVNIKMVKVTKSLKPLKKCFIFGWVWWQRQNITFNGRTQFTI